MGLKFSFDDDAIEERSTGTANQFCNLHHFVRVVVVVVILFHVHQDPAPAGI